jgi:iron complex outermembrane receptor protein
MLSLKSLSKLTTSSCGIFFLTFTSLLIPVSSIHASETAGIEEVIVTARKREERLIDVPVSAAVLTQAEIERYRTRDLGELTERIPGVTIQHGGGGAQGGNIEIRGVGNIAVDYGTDQPVSIVLDGMSFQRSHMLDTGFFDLQTLEVLKGPQAVYFGKNSPAGVIGVTSVSPVIGEDINGFIRASYELVTEDPVIEGGVSFTLSDTIAMRIAGRFQDMSGGWLENSAAPIDAQQGDAFLGLPMYTDPALQPRGPSHDEYPAQEQTVVRWTTVWQPTDNFEAKLKVFYSESEQNDTARTILYGCADGVGGHPHFGASVFLWEDTTQTCGNSPRLKRNSALPPAGVINKAFGVDENDRFYNNFENDLITLELNWDLGRYQITSLTGVWDYTHREYTNYDYTSFAVVVSDQGERGDSFTQEFRLQSDFDGNFNFMVGVFYEDLWRELEAPVQILPETLANVFGASAPWPVADAYEGTYMMYHQIWDNDVESFSVFGSFDYQINDKWELSGGLRYTEEDRKAVGGNIFENSGAFGFGPTSIQYTPSDTSDNLSPELTISYHPREDIMLFAAYKTGFQSAGISNPGTVPNLTALPIDVANDTLVFDETTVEGFELGMKGRFLGNSMSAEVIAFYFESEDLQVGIFNSNTTTFTLQNAAVALNYGVEMNMLYQLDESWQLRGALSYAHLEFDDWEDAGCNSIDTPNTGIGTCFTNDLGANVQDMSGKAYGGPPLSVSIGATYFRPVSDGWAIETSFDTIYHSDGEETLQQAGTDIPDRAVTNVAISLFQQDGPWSVDLTCTNCFNEIYVTSIQNKPLQKIIPDLASDLTGTINPPRLVRFGVTYSFD